jgi:fructosamine-3-kinase
LSIEAALQRAVESALRQKGHDRATVATATSIGGGSINRTFLLTLNSGERCFLKTHSDPPPGFFTAEARGLEALAAAGVLRVPQVLHLHDPPHPKCLAPSRPSPEDPQNRLAPFLLLEAIETGPPHPGLSERFGHELAELHRIARSDLFGFPHDNYLGLTPQPNERHEDWCTFWRRHRLGHQLELARQRGLSDPTLDRLGDRLMDRLESWIAEPADPPSLLHGDLWGGNYLTDSGGAPVLIDPAVYHGRREADLAMTRLFGGFDARFYAAYEEAWPLAPEAEDRLTIYELYHLLNHLNLFGRGYRDGCMTRLSALVA